MKYNKFLFLILLLLVTAAGCSRDKDKNVDEAETIEVPSDPEPQEPPQNVGDFYKSFIGQWQEIACGNESYPKLNPSDRVIEFSEDGTSDYYYSLISIYRADAEFLYLNSGKDPDGHTFRHTFTGSDTLRLDYVAGAIEMSMDTPTFSIYKRLK